ncbi:MAG TPA: hypothetical protein VJ746_19965 [Nitrospira sp.]|nr:hypothetical protein [Nitrospira sp.]
MNVIRSATAYGGPYDAGVAGTSMNPIVSLLLKQLPNLVPVVESLVRKNATPRPDLERLANVEVSLERLTRRSNDLEAKLRRATFLAVLSVLASAVGILTVLLR